MPASRRARATTLAPRSARPGPARRPPGCVPLTPRPYGTAEPPGEDGEGAEPSPATAGRRRARPVQVVGDTASRSPEAAASTVTVIASSPPTAARRGRSEGAVTEQRTSGAGQQQPAQQRPVRAARAAPAGPPGHHDLQPGGGSGTRCRARRRRGGPGTAPSPRPAGRGAGQRPRTASRVRGRPSPCAPRRPRRSAGEDVRTAPPRPDPARTRLPQCWSAPAAAEHLDGGAVGELRGPGRAR